MHTYTEKDFVPKSIDFIDKMIVLRFHAIPIEKDDDRIAHLMEDPFIPPDKTILGVYCIYRKSVLYVLDGSINSFNTPEFKTAFSADRLIKEEELEYVLDFAPLVIVASEDSTYISQYFIGGSSKKLDSILNVCLGYPKITSKKHVNNILKPFNEDIVTVENMGYLPNILNESACTQDF
ncbi:hypothetical protein [Alkalicoccus daliensis]|uniref:Uncharacterized protein n=1 Tax=Alkalicoccus daliensis TaxID=745820 RepID=A0A1H0D2H1_9BACI|nr:hypothetical protein [Alkalicoccus daliensis]SDN64319.1 hypothetical protein SAMN04488053_102320 [Alkalicoccus daliensis]